MRYFIGNRSCLFFKNSERDNYAVTFDIQRSACPFAAVAPIRLAGNALSCSCKQSALFKLCTQQRIFLRRAQFLLSAVFRDRSCTANVKSSLRIPCILRFAALIRISCINSVRCCVRAAKSSCLKTHLKFWTAALKIIHPIPAVQKSQCCRRLRFLKPRKAVIAAL